MSPATRVAWALLESFVALPMTNIDHMQAQNARNRQLYSAYASKWYLFKEASMYKYSACYVSSYTSCSGSSGVILPPLMIYLDRMHTCSTLNRQRYLAQQSERYLLKEAAVEFYSAYLILLLHELHGLFRGDTSHLRWPIWIVWQQNERYFRQR